MKLLMEQWRRYAQSLEESAYKDALKKLPREIPEETWKEYLNFIRELDPSGKSKYVKWMADEVRYIMVPHGQKARPDESADNINMEKITRFMDVIKKYDELLPHIKASKEHKEFADIGKVMGISQLRTLVWDMEAIANRKAVEKETGMNHKELARAESEVVDQEEGLFILRRPYTTHASCHYGQGTKWCVSGRENNQFLAYSDENIVLFFLDTAIKLPAQKSHFQKVAFSVMYDYYDRGDTEVDAVYDAKDKMHTLGEFRRSMKDFIPPERIDEMVKKMLESTNSHPPIEGGVGSDIGEKFKGDAEWEPKLSSWEDVMGTNLKAVGADEEVEEGRDYQRDSEKIKKHPKNKKDLLDKGANKDTGGGKGHKKTSTKRGKSAPPSG
jgi:hypothetical protein